MPTDSSPFESSNVELKEIINNSWDGICIIDKKTNFIYLNDAISPMLGYQKNELLSQPFLSFIKREYKEAFLQLLKDNIENSYNTDIDLACTRKDNKPIYLKITVSLMLNKKYFVVNAKDITKEISDDEILNNYVLSLHLDTNETITKVSNAFCKLSGYSQEELIHKEFYDLKHKEMELQEFNNNIQDLKSRRKNTEKFRLSKADTESFYVDIKMKSIHNKYGDTIGYTLLMFDITNELLLDQKLSIENSKLIIMGETITTISHEWRQPLNIISLKAQNLQFSIDDEESVQTLDEIQEKAKELSNTIEDFQNIIKIKSSKTQTTIKDVIHKSIRKFNEKYSNVICFDIQNQYENPTDLYERELIKIFISLFINSYDAFTSKNIKKQNIHLSSYEKDNYIYIQVKDNAGGIPKDVLPRIYEPYYSTKELRHGVGLGLYMTKTVIQMHLGGTIEIENEDEGICVTLKIPLT